MTTLAATFKPPVFVRRRFPAGLVISAVVLGLAGLALAIPGLLTPYDPLVGETALRLQPPSLAHPFGTDQLGRDLLARVIWGTRQSLAGAGLAVALALVVGSLVGMLAAVSPKPVHAVIMRLVDVLLSIPWLLTALSLVLVLGPGVVNAALAVGVGSVALFARLARTETLRLRQAEYVQAAIHLGGKPGKVLFRHIAPGLISPVLALAALQCGAAILTLSTLGFLGFGVTPPTPEWGMLIAEGRKYMASAWWLTTLPGVAVTVTVLALAAIARRLKKGRIQ